MNPVYTNKHIIVCDWFLRDVFYNPWLRENVGKEMIDWAWVWESHDSYSAYHYGICTKNTEDMLAFRLRFGV